MTRSEIERFSRSCRSLGISPDSLYLLAFSGGSDSVYLAEVGKEYFSRGKLILCYVNYHDSPAVSEEWEIVKETAERTGLSLIRKDVHLPSDSTDFEDKARRIRYSWFSELSKELNAFGVLVAHQRNDDAETYLLQKQRGGIVSYFGLKPEVDLGGTRIFRPLLGEYRNSMILSLKRDGIRYFDDPTNYNPERKRDALRMGRLIDDSAVDEILKERDEKLLEFLKRIDRVDSFFPTDRIDLKAYRSLDDESKRRALLRCLNSVFPGSDREHLLGLVNLCFDFLKGGETKKLKLESGICLYPTYSSFFFGKDMESDVDFSYQVSGPEKLTTEYFTLDIKSPSEVGTDAFPLTVRRIRRGDVISTKIAGKDAYSFIKKHRAPAWIRDRYPGVFDMRGNLMFVPMFDDGQKQPLYPKIPDFIPLK